jgi:hypothetical protein
MPLAEGLDAAAKVSRRSRRISARRVIGRQGRRFRDRHYWWHGNCYLHARNGNWYRVSHRYCH